MQLIMYNLNPSIIASILKTLVRKFRVWKNEANACDVPC